MPRVQPAPRNQPPRLEEPKPRCSLLRILAVATVGVGILLGGMAKWGQKPVAEEISRGQLPPNSFDCTPGLLQPYQIAARVLGSPVPHPSYPSRMLHPGIVTLGDGGMAYIPDPREEKFRQEHPRRAALTQWVDVQAKNYSEVEAFRKKESAEDNKGFELGLPAEGQIERYLVALNPLKVANHKIATQKVETLVAKLGDLSEGEICQSLRDIHSALLKGIKGAAPGKYRNRQGVVFKDTKEDQDRSYAGLVKLIRDRSPNGEKNRNVEILEKRIFPKLANGETLNAKETVVASLLGYIPPSHQDIPRLMRVYARNLRSMSNQMRQCSNFDPLAFASFAHQEFGRIHPFVDGNGRMARLIMNAILTNAGYPPVVFPSDEKYTEAVTSDAKIPGSFSQFLTGALNWTKEQFGLPCLAELSCD